MTKETKIGLAIMVIFAIGAGYIVYQARPVVQLRDVYEKNSDQVDSDANLDEDEMEHDDHGEGKATSGDTAAAEVGNQMDVTAQLSFSLSQVQTHSTSQDCWATINGSVYDLSSWISRHPGGSRAIEQLCGTDASDKFNKQHGKSKAAQSTLVLLKIGQLSQ
ncbi:cytochrome b5 domain-containing protein [Candidatus Nomurabacteria bacterium]|nr:cytochrome b5 domain-containing protein [Candidatus Nomurabacteria bacterium]